MNDSGHWPLDQWAPVLPRSLQCTAWKYASPEQFHKDSCRTAESGKAHTLQVSVGNKNAEIKEDPERVTVYEHESGERLSSHSGERHVSSDSVRSHLRWIAP